MSDGGTVYRAAAPRIWTHSAVPALGLAIIGLGLAILSDPGLISREGMIGWSTSQIGLFAAVLAQAIVLLGRGIDLSVGAAISFVNVVAIQLFGIGCPIAMVVPLAVLCGLAVGVANGLLVAYLRINALLATFASAFVLLGLTLQLQAVPGGMAPANLVSFANGDFLGAPIAIWGLAALVLLWQIIAASRFMLRLLAIGSDPRRAFDSGVPLQATRFISYVVDGLFCGLAGLFVTMTIGAGDPLIGQSYTLLTIAGAVIGGVALMGGSGTGIGAILGAVFIGIIGDLVLAMNISAFYQQAIVGGVLLAGLAGLVTLLRWTDATERKRIISALRKSR
jgi:ribose transport system permease protein